MRFLFNPHLWTGGLRGLGRRIVQDAKAARRGELRVAPGMRGRIYQRREPEQVSGQLVQKPDDAGGSTIAAPLPRSATMTLTIVRADGTREPGPVVPCTVEHIEHGGNG